VGEVWVGIVEDASSPAIEDHSEQLMSEFEAGVPQRSKDS